MSVSEPIANIHNPALTLSDRKAQTIRSAPEITIRPPSRKMTEPPTSAGAPPSMTAAPMNSPSSVNRRAPAEIAMPQDADQRIDDSEHDHRHDKAGRLETRTPHVRPWVCQCGRWYSHHS